MGTLAIKTDERVRNRLRLYAFFWVTECLPIHFQGHCQSEHLGQGDGWL